MYQKYAPCKETKIVQYTFLLLQRPDVPRAHINVRQKSNRTLKGNLAILAQKLKHPSYTKPPRSLKALVLYPCTSDSTATISF